MARSSVAIDRRNLRRQYKMGNGYSIFYGILLAGIAMGLSFFLAGSAGISNIVVPPFLHNSITGMLYIYNAVALSLIWLSALLLPRPYHFAALLDNSWNMMYKLGVRPGALAMNKVRVTVMSQLATYLEGYLLAALVGYLKSADKVIDTRLAILLALVGLASVLILVMPALAVGALTRSRAGIRFVLLLLGGGLGYLLYFNKYFVCASESDIAASAERLISLDPLGLALIAVLFTIAFPIIAISAASSRARNYLVEDLDATDLQSLGIREDILILSPRRSKYQVVISGPDVNGSSQSIPIPPLHDDAADDGERPSRRQRDE